MDPFAPVRGKCTYWRERANQDDVWDFRLRKEDRRVDCSCFIEGQQWPATVSTVPSDCPERFHCRYYIRNA